MSEISQQHGMDIDTTYECPHCHIELPAANQFTHEVACARMHRDGQRAPELQRIVRQSSSSAIPDSNAQQRSQPMPRREDRRVAEIAENRLVNCPNCEKSVRELDINRHMDDECLKNEMIPCEFCDEGIPMSNYNQHIESCQRRNQENHREQPPVHERMESEHEEEDDEEEEHEEQPQRQQGPNASDNGSSQGGVRGFLRNLASSAANHLLGLNPENQERREHELEQRRREEERQREFLEHMFGQPQVPRNMVPSNQNALIPYNGPNNGGQRVIRTVERGPFGSVIVRSRVIPANNNQFQMFQQPQMSRPMEVNPLEMLINSMMGGGMIPIGNGEFENGGAPEERGLNKETIDSLALIKYNKEANKNVSEDLKKCPICLDEFEEGQEVRFLWCTHRFHKGCVDKWLEDHTACPICKKDFSEAEQGFSP